jgi:hypothetical protein
MLKLYDELAGRARTMNQINLLHISLGNTITPSEAVFLYENLFRPGVHQMPALHADRTFTDNEFARAARDWIDKLMVDLRTIQKVDPEPFGRRDLRESVTLFTDGGPSADKTLLVTLPGGNFRLMMPIPTFLQNINAAKTDVLVIRDGTKSSYTAGLEGLAGSIGELGAGIRSLLDIEGYKRLAGIGVSAGALPIALVATQLDFDAVLCCGAGSPYHSKWENSAASPPAILREAARSGFNRRVVIAYGAHSAADATSAAEISELLTVEAVEVSVDDFQIEHNILHPLSTRRLLGEFFERHLGLEN